MDTQTRRALKNDSFISATRSGISWVDDHRGKVYIAAAIVALLVLLGVGGYFYNQHRNDLASADFGAAMDIYNAQLQQPGQPAEAGVLTFPTAAARASAAAKKFDAITKDYRFTKTAENARYFAGLMYMDAGENATAESDLKAVADSWDRNLSDLAKTALATLYHQTGRDAAAVDLLKQVTAKPSSTVSASTAQLELADLYDSSNQHAEANRIYADLKDKDKDGAAGRIAASKLTTAH